MTKADEVREGLKYKKPKRSVHQDIDFLSTGSTLLDLGCSGRLAGGFAKGKYYFLVGDSDSGKSFLSMSCYAEACLNPNFKDYRLIHDDVEGGVLMDVAKMFGQEAASRIEPPAGTRSKPRYSSTVEEFFFHLKDAFDLGTPFVYVLDSEDALPPEAWLKTQDKKRKIALKGRAPAQEDKTGSYGTEKAKANSVGMRSVIAKLRDSGSILLIISQTRDNIGWNSQYQPKTHGGGHALTFYATVKMWSSVRKRLTVSYKDKDRVQGILARLDIKRTRFTGRPVKVDIPIYWSSGIDDIGSCVDWLLEEKHWKENNGVIIVPEWETSPLNRDDLVAYIEEASLSEELRQVVAGTWARIEAATVSGRLNKYQQKGEGT